MPNLVCGTRVQVAPCSGVGSEKCGTVIPPQRKWPKGARKSPGPNEVWVRLDDGRIITMFRNRLREL